MCRRKGLHDLGARQRALCTSVLPAYHSHRNSHKLIPYTNLFFNRNPEFQKLSFEQTLQTFTSRISRAIFANFTKLIPAKNQCCIAKVLVSMVKLPCFALSAVWCRYAHLLSMTGSTPTPWDSHASKNSDHLMLCAFTFKKKRKAAEEAQTMAPSKTPRSNGAEMGKNNCFYATPPLPPILNFEAGDSGHSKLILEGMHNQGHHCREYLGLLISQEWHPVDMMLSQTAAQKRGMIVFGCILCVVQLAVRKPQ